MLSEKNLYIFVANPYGYEVERISKVLKNLEKDRELFLNISIIPPSKTSLSDIKSYYLLDDHINPLGHYNLYNSIKSVIN